LRLAVRFAESVLGSVAGGLGAASRLLQGRSSGKAGFRFAE
jgi:hypothetical protein